MSGKNRPNPLPGDTEMLEPSDDAPIPGDIGLGAAVGKVSAVDAALMRTVETADRLGQAGSPLSAEDLGTPSGGVPRLMPRQAFLQKYRLPTNVNVADVGIGRLT